MLALWALLIGTPALAAEPCTATDAPAVRALVEQAATALLDDDTERHDVLVGTLRSNTVCLTSVVPPEAWGELLYQMALVRYARKLPWEPLVDTALMAFPSLPRTVGPAPVRSRVPVVSAGAYATPTDPTALWYLDGRPAPARFNLDGPHILQVERGGVLSSAWVEGGALPAFWAAAPPPAPEPMPVPPEPEVEPTPAPPVASPPKAEPSSAIALRVHVGAGVSLAIGEAVVTTLGTEPALKVVVPVEAGARLDVGPGWLRLAGEFTPLVNGPYVYDDAGTVRATSLGGGGHVAGGGHIGVGSVGALVGLRDPGRLVVQAVGGAELHRSGVGLELRAGLQLTTELGVEPAFGLLLVVDPKVWSR